MLAVIKTGGKQYLVSPGQKIKIEKLGEPAYAKAASFAEVASATKAESAGKEVVFDQVLLLEKNKKVEIGTPFVKEAKVIGKVLGQGKAKKVIIFKYKAKKRYHKKAGHRQPFTEVEIVKITAP